MEPILLEVPTELSTQRLLLRGRQAGDSPMVLDSVRSSLAELKQFMPWAKDDYGLEDAETWCRKSAAWFLTREQLQFVILLRESGLHIGNIGAFNFDWTVPRCEIGYWLRTDHTRNGYMTEALRGLTDMLFDTLHFHRVEIRCDDRNLASARVAELCGYTLDAVLQNDCRTPEGHLRDTRIYSRTSATEKNIPV